MNAHEPFIEMKPYLGHAESRRIAALSNYKIEEFQHLAQQELLLAQSIAGHGDTWGIWQTPQAISQGNFKTSYRAINLGKRLRDYLIKESIPEVSIDELVNEGVLTLTRLAVLMRLAPTGGSGTTKNRRLKPSTIAGILYVNSTQIIAKAIRRKAQRVDAQGLLAGLTDEDVRDLGKTKKNRIELDRLKTLRARGCWTDLPPQPDVTLTTDPRGPKKTQSQQEISSEYQPLPDDYLAEIGPRILWLIRDLGPNLLAVLEDFALYLKRLDWSEVTSNKLHGKFGLVVKFIEKHLQNKPWMDRSGKPLKPNFPLTTGRSSNDRFEWPPRSYGHLKILSVTLQSAHLFITLLASAGRIGEVENLRRSSVITARDGKDYVRGWTYKLSGNLFGDARQWPAPDVFVQALGQQARLASVWGQLPPRGLSEGFSEAFVNHQFLWLSLGRGGRSNAANQLNNSSTALRILANRVGMDPRPGGINIHPHRFRKTIGRLAGIALFDSPLVLQRLFGHKSAEMTLHYILCNEDIRTEAEAVLRELRILHCAEALEEVRAALASGAELPRHGGPSAAKIVEAVKDQEARLTSSGRVWNDGSAYELAYLLTANGKGWRFIQKNVVCTKVPGEDGMCRKSRRLGEPDTSNCKPECGNRMVLAIERRDIDEIAQSYLDIATEAHEQGQILILYEVMQRFIEEVDAFPDIKAKYFSDPKVQSLLSIFNESSQ